MLSNVKSFAGVPSQFFTGVSPVMPENIVNPGVPHVPKRSFMLPFVAGGSRGEFATSLLRKLRNLMDSLSPSPASCLNSFKKFAFNAFTSSGRATAILVEPLKETAFKFLLPMTAPSPERAAIRALSVAMPEISESFSPAMPMEAI